MADEESNFQNESQNTENLQANLQGEGKGLMDQNFEGEDLQENLPSGMQGEMGQHFEGEEMDGEEMEGEEMEGEEEEEGEELEEGEEGQLLQGEEEELDNNSSANMPSHSQSKVYINNPDEGEEEGEEQQMEEEGEEANVVEEKKEIHYNGDFNIYHPPERKVRYILLKFINKMRQSRGLPKYTIDLHGNNLAMEYAKYYLEYYMCEKKEEKEDPEIVKQKLIKKYLMNKDQIKFSVFDSAIETDSTNPRIDTFSDDFYDAQATLIEYEEDCKNILNEDFNQVGIGLAFNNTHLVVVNIFSTSKILIGNCSINKEHASLILKGTVVDDKFGPYAMKINKLDEKGKPIVQITPQNIKVSEENGVRCFEAKFSNITPVIEDINDKVLEVYIREKPETIEYGKQLYTAVSFDKLQLGTRIPVYSFPSEIAKTEEKDQDDKDQAKEKEIKNNNEQLKRDIEDERAHRNSKTGQKEEAMGTIQEEDDENNNLSDNVSEERGSEAEKEKNEIVEEKNYENENIDHEIEKIKGENQKLKEEDEKFQNKIRILFELKKEIGKEEKNFYKDSNINDSTYTDSLSSAAALYIELNKNKLKLDNDLKKYQDSIEEQEKKKQEVYKILMEYKTELLDNAETRKGTKIPKKQRDKWLDEEKRDEDEIKRLRIQSFTKTLELNRLKKEFKKMEDYFEGLHIIDFEQLKIENNTLTEKIEDRNEEIHKLRGKINTTVQILAHLQEKSENIEAQKKAHEKIAKELLESINKKKKDLNDQKEKSEKKGRKQLSENKKIDELNSEDLKNYYYKTLDNIEDLSEKIDKVSQELAHYREKRGHGTADIIELLKRKKAMLEDYKNLPKKPDDK